LLGAPLGDRASRLRIGFLPEHFRFHDCLTGRELLRFHGRLHGLRSFALESRIDSLLGRVDLLDAADRPLKGYSKGMLQRAGLAQALINDPLLVFLDEPTSGLDPLGRFLVRDIISELRSKGTSVFLNSHLLGEVEATCDRVAFVKHGRIVRELTLAEAAPKLDVELVAEPLHDSVLDGLRQFAMIAERSPDGKIRLLVTRESAVPEMVRWLVSRNVNVHAVHARPKSLEEWFLEVMGEDQRPG
jgi:ABC-2 type transport system ATP-binding protein